jgi:hypothetical protein
MAAGALALLIITLSALAATAMRPWVQFVQNAQQSLFACQQAQSSDCTKQVSAAQQSLAQFAQNVSLLEKVPGLRQFPPIISAHAQLLSGVSTLQACVANCQDVNLDETVIQTFQAITATRKALRESPVWNYLAAQSDTLASYQAALEHLAESSQSFEALLPHTSTLLGLNKPITYRFLLQNNKEIRPSGGFMGSFATITLNESRIDDLKVEDIYVPDGQIKGYVSEPYGIKQYLFDGDHPGWRLRDSNWHPDFPTAAESINWFFAEGQERPADVLVALNLSTVEKFLSLLGPIEVLDYGVTIDSQSIYAITQAQAEHNFFPGSTQKGDFLRSLAQAFSQKIEEAPLETRLRIFELLRLELTRGEILLVANDPTLQDALKVSGLTGSLPAIDCLEFGCAPNVLGVIEANVGSTKANCCITRDFRSEIQLTPEAMLQELTLTFSNSSLPNPEPPYHFGGGYKNYLRLVLPKDVSVNRIAIDGISLDPNSIDTQAFGNYSFWGFLHLVEGGKTSTITISLAKPRTANAPKESLILIKQPGIPDVPWNIRVLSGQETNHALNLSKTLSIPLP